MINTRFDAPTLAPRTPAPRAVAAPALDRVTLSVRSPFETMPAPGAAGISAPAPVPSTADAAPVRLGWKSAVLGVVAAAAVAGAVGVVIGQNTPAPEPTGPVSGEVVVPPGMSTSEARQAFNDLRYLHTVGLRGGGGLSRSVLGIIPQSVEPQRALEELAKGNEISFKATTMGTSHPIKDVGQLSDLANRVREAQIRQVIGDTIDQVGRSLNDAIRNGTDQIQQGWDSAGQPQR